MLCKTEDVWCRSWQMSNQQPSRFVFQGSIATELQHRYTLRVGEDSIAAIATRYGLGGPGIEFRCGRNFPHLSHPVRPASYTWAQHLIPGLIFFREIIIRSEMATEWDTWQLCTSVCANPEVGISPHSLCGGPWVNFYNSVPRISRWRRKCSSVCALISVSVWGNWC